MRSHVVTEKLLIRSIIFVNNMARKQNLSLPKITDFMQPLSSMAAHELREEQDGPASPKRTKHRDRYDAKWEEEFPWLNYVLEDQEDGQSMLCSVCAKHKESSKRMVWITVPCKFFRKDKLCEHKRSQCHVDATKAEAMAVAFGRPGGVCACIEEQVSLERQAILGEFKCVYWLAKEETAHHTMFSSLLELGKSLGCAYFNKLEVGKNASYTSHRMIDEFLLILSDCVEKDVLSKVKASPAVGILCDESTDVSNLKQLVVFVRYLIKGKPCTSCENSRFGSWYS